MSPFWRGFFSIFFFGKQPCWFFGHEWVADFDDYWKSRPQPADIFQRMCQQIEMTLLYGWPAKKCCKCGLKDKVTWSSEAPNGEFVGPGENFR